MFELLSIPAVIALVEALKMAGLPSKFAAIGAIVLGAAFGFIIGDVISGLLYGLSASGIYSGYKAMVQ